MQDLEKEFIGKGDVRGFLFKQLLANETAYLYEVSTENTTHYEVFKRVEKKAATYVLDGKEVNTAAKVVYPKTKQFGLTAWTFTNYEKALERFNSISSKNTQR